MAQRKVTEDDMVQAFLDTLVRMTGDQTIAGVKTFSGGLYASGNGTTNQYVRLLGSVDPQVQMVNGDGDLCFFQLLSAASGGRALRIYDQTAGAERFRMDDVGNFGYGTNNPLMGIHLAKSVGNNVYGGLDGDANQFIIRGNAYYDTTNTRIEPITTGYQTNISLDNAVGSIKFETSTSSVATGSAATLATALTIDNTQNSNFAGRILCDDVTDATSTTDGSLQTDGGLSVAKKAYIGADVYTAGFYDCATAKGLKVAGTQVVTNQQTALTVGLTGITATAPSTPDYAIQDLTNSGGYGFVTADEGQTVLSVITNLQTRVNELETKLQAHGLIA